MLKAEGRRLADVLEQGAQLVRTVDGGVEISVRVVPGSSRRSVGPVVNGSLRVRVTAPPERGRANREAAGLVAAAVGGRRGRVAAGARGRMKRVFVADVEAGEALRRLADLGGDGTEG